jgi:hypothetical protein
MRLIVRAPKENEQLQQNTVRRVGLALSRFAPRLASVTVVVAENAGGVSCSVRVRCAPSGEVVEEVVDEDLDGAMHRTLSRVVRSLERTLGGGERRRR